MAQITIMIGSNGESLPVEQIELGETSVNQLIQELVNSNQVPELAQGHEYRLTGPNNEILNGAVTLEKAGIKDGDTVNLLDKTTGAVKTSFVQSSGNAK